MALALAVEPLDDRALALDRVHARELARVDQDLVLGVGDERLASLAAVSCRAAWASAGATTWTDREVERLREVVVALVVRRHGHDRAGPVLHQHVVRDEHRDLLAGDRVRHRAPERHAGLRLVDVATQLGGFGDRCVDVLVNLLLVLGALGELEHVGVLGGHHEERGAEQRVRPGGEHRVVDPKLLAAEHDLGALAAPDPVALHRLDVLGPVDRGQVVEQAVGVVGDAEEPLLELANLHQVAAALAASVDHLLVGEHRLVVRAPLDRGLLAVRKVALEQLEEDPLRPAVVRRLVGAELAAPVDRDPPAMEPVAVGRDRPVGGDPRVHAGLDRVVLRGQPERVVAHRVQHAPADPAVEVRDRVAERVVLQVPDVRLAARVGQHLEDVGLLTVVAVLVGHRVVRHLPRALARPHLLPLGFDLLGVIAPFRHSY